MQNISSKVYDALENRPVSVRVKGIVSLTLFLLPFDSFYLKLVLSFNPDCMILFVESSLNMPL